MTASFVATAFLFLLLCGWLVKEQLRRIRVKDQIDRGNTRLANGTDRHCDRKLAWLLIASPDLRIRFANERYFRITFQGADEVLGRKIQDLIMAEGVEARAKSLLSRIDPAGTCCFNAFIRVGLGSKRPVHVTMAWIAPLVGEDCVVLVLEDLLQGPDFAAGRYKC